MQRKSLLAIGASAAAGVAVGLFTERLLEPERPSIDPMPSLVPAETGRLSEHRSPPHDLAELAGSRYRRQAFVESLETLDSEGCAELFARYSKKTRLTGTAPQHGFEKLLEHWTTIDPERAMRGMLALPKSRVPGGRRLIDTAVKGWAAATANNEGALTAVLPQLLAISSRELRSTFVKGLLGGIDAPTFRETLQRAKVLTGMLPAISSERQ